MAQPPPEAPPRRGARSRFWEWVRHHTTAVIVDDRRLQRDGRRRRARAPRRRSPPRPIGGVRGRGHQLHAEPPLHLPRGGSPCAARRWRFALVSRLQPRAQHAGRISVPRRCSHLHYLVARVITSMIVSNVWNYPLQRFFVFSERPSRRAHEPEPAQESDEPTSRTAVPGPESRALRAREDAHVAPGLQGYAVMAGHRRRRGAGQRGHRRRRQHVPRLHRRHRRERARPLAPDAASRRCRSRSRAASVGSFTSRGARRARSSASRRTPPAPGVHRLQLYSGGAEAVESALRLAKSPHGQVRVRQLLGRLPRQDDGRAVADGLDVQGQARADGAGRAPGPVRRLLPLPARARRTRAAASPAPRSRASRSRSRRAGAVAGVIVEPMQGTAGNVDPAQGVPARGARRSPTSSARCSSPTR